MGNNKGHLQPCHLQERQCVLSKASTVAKVLISKDSRMNAGRYTQLKVGFTHVQWIESSLEMT